MANKNSYTDLQGARFSLEQLDEAESRLLADLQKQAKNSSDWNSFENYWTSAVARFYDARALSRKASRQTLVYKIAQDLSARLAVSAGLARLPDYRDELAGVIRKHFRTRREFCE